MQFLINLRDYVRSNVEDAATILYTWDSETGVSASRQPDVITDNVNIWSDRVKKPMDFNTAQNENLHFTAMQTENKSWATYEWGHSIPRGDFDNYRDVKGVKMTYSFNHLYTVPNKKKNRLD